MISQGAFLRRLAACVGASFALIALSLVCGMLGYHWLEGMSWVDAFLNAAMILSGMGPVSPLKTNAGKLFAGGYALYSGLALIVATGMIIAPVVHRVLHRFHLEIDEDE